MTGPATTPGEPGSLVPKTAGELRLERQIAIYLKILAPAMDALYELQAAAEHRGLNCEIWHGSEERP